MPSRIQSNSGGSEYDSEASKMLHKPDQVLKACIQGLQTKSDCTEWIEAEIQGQQRKKVIALLNQRKGEL